MTVPLETYAQKRDFGRTPEPSPYRPSIREGPLLFVVQKHAARRLHYDFRLEVDGVLKSWAVPKGPSLDPVEKRLAVMVEDHPLDYALFEGVIPKGEYGAGEVIAWDIGHYFPDEGGLTASQTRAEAEERMRQGLAAGKLSISLEGQKLKGSWALVRMKGSAKDWLLIKHNDGFADPRRDILQDDRSVLSSVPGEEVDGASAPAVLLERVPGARRGPLPASIAPMLPTLAEAPFSHPDWTFEPKLDGIRAIAIVDQGKVSLLSRGGLDATARYPALVEELSRQRHGAMVLDGEIVALDEHERPSFERLQERLHLSQLSDIVLADQANPVIYYVFDLLYLDGFDLRHVPLAHRTTLLRRVLVVSQHVRQVESFEKDGEAVYQAMVGYGLEGVIGKRRDSLYEAGRRSHHWLKVKGTLSDDFVIGGYSQGSGARRDTFGSLLLGAYSAEGLQFVGHVGTGFDERALNDLRALLDSLQTKDCPFVPEPRVNAPATWVRPELVAEIKFARRTHDGQLREPVFLRLRGDKAPAEATGAAPAPAPLPSSGEGARGGQATPAAPEAGEGPLAPSLHGGRGNRELEARAKTVILRPQAEESVPPGHGSFASLRMTTAFSAGPLERILGQLAAPGESLALQVEGREIQLTNLDKALWPAAEGQRPLTKRDLIAYLVRVSPYLLPHLADRPVTLVRCPDGITGQRFYQKHIDLGLPDFVTTVRLFSEHGEGDRDYLICNNLATLLWLGQIAVLELHTWYSRVNPHPDGHHLTTQFWGSEAAIEGSALNYPDFIVFDLDPYIYSGREAEGEEPELNRAAYAKTAEVAWWLKELLEALALPPFVKTSGRTGLHIFVPVLRQFDYDAVRSACETIGRFLLRQHPRDLTMEWAVSKRKGKVFLDHKQNVRGKTLASIFSPRVASGGTVSMPLSWEEVGQAYPPNFTILTAPGRLEEKGDPWAGILDAKRDLRSKFQAPSSKLQVPGSGSQVPGPRTLTIEL